MILPLHTDLRRAITSALEDLYGLAPDAMPPIVIEYPPNRRMGDLAVTVAFDLARVLRKAPRLIAAEIARAAAGREDLGRLEATGAGYLNLFLDRPRFARALIGGEPPAPASGEREKTIVEHTAINPNKAAHVGHLRNAALGDTLCRLLRFRGADVEVQNYIDDTGVQVADVVVGLRELEGKDVGEVRRLAAEPRFDHYCWDLYARVTQWYEEDDARLSYRRDALHDLEHDADPTAAMARAVTESIVRCHLRTMARLGVEYDLLSWEGDILRLAFWDRAFEILKASGAVRLQADGRLAGCWVMPIDDAGEAGATQGDAGKPGAARAGKPGAAQGDAGEPGGAQGDAGEAGAAQGDAGGDPDARLKVIVRSNGTVTYVGKDIAYQLWKFGLLGRDFRYRRFDAQLPGRPLWTTSSTAAPDGEGTAPVGGGTATPPAGGPAGPDAGAAAPDAGGAPPRFGRAAAVYNVIDTRQSYLQRLLAQALAALDHPKEAERSIHFSYEMVALSRSTARALGHGDDDGKAFVEVSGRKGLGVKADDLLDQVTARAEQEVAARHPDLAEGERRRTAGIISTAAVRYFMIKFSRGKVIAFDIDEALSFEGETGPYLQYAAVRARKILQKLHERSGLAATDIAQSLATTPDAPLADAAGDELWGLVLEASRLDEVADQAVRTLELSVLAKYAFGLAQRFNGFYHSSPVVAEPDEATRLWRAAGVAWFEARMTRALALMGCEVPDRM